MPMMTTTIRSSISVNPFFLLRTIFQYSLQSGLDVCVCFGGKTTQIGKKQREGQEYCSPLNPFTPTTYSVIPLKYTGIYRAHFARILAFCNNRTAYLAASTGPCGRPAVPSLERQISALIRTCG